MKKIYLAVLIIALAIGLLGAAITGYFILGKKNCEIDELTYYYADWCGWCQKIKNEGTIQKLKELGVNVKEINVDIGPIEHEFRGVPTFVIDSEIYSGYRTFEQLKSILKCK